MGLSSAYLGKGSPKPQFPHLEGSACSVCLEARIWESSKQIGKRIRGNSYQWSDE